MVEPVYVGGGVHDRSRCFEVKSSIIGNNFEKTHWTYPIGAKSNEVLEQAHDLSRNWCFCRLVQTQCEITCFQRSYELILPISKYPVVHMWLWGPVSRRLVLPSMELACSSLFLHASYRSLLARTSAANQDAASHLRQSGRLSCHHGEFYSHSREARLNMNAISLYFPNTLIRLWPMYHFDLWRCSWKKQIPYKLKWEQRTMIIVATWAPMRA